MTSEPHDVYQRELSDWKETKDVLFALAEDKGWIFRGQQSSEWGLQPTVERLADYFGDEADAHHLGTLEECLLLQFKRRMHHYIDGPLLPESRVEELALMQHHGAPTRLLDFTRSPWIAAFFALETADKASKCAIWAVSRPWCQTVATDKLADLRHADPKQRAKDEHVRIVIELEDPARSGLLFADSVYKNHEIVFVVEPMKMNPRLTAQQGLFLCATHDTKRLQEILLSYPQATSQEWLRKLIIPSSVRREALQELRNMNITRATLFPGIDGLAQSLANELFTDEGRHLERITHERLIRERDDALEGKGSA